MSDTPKTPRPSGPVLIDLEADAAPVPDPARVPEVPEPMAEAQAAAMQRAAAMAARPPSRIGRWIWGALTALIGVILSTSLWSYAAGLVERVPVLGYLVIALLAVLGLALTALILRETAAWFRLGRLDGLHKAGVSAAASHDLSAARAVTDRLLAFYAGRVDLERGRQRLTERRDDAFDADALLGLAERELLLPLDRAARAEVERAARQVATVTALVPLAMADVFTALASNIRMIRRIAEIYGGRSGTFGSWRLTRAVLSHLVATGAVAVGDDLISSVAGGNVLSRISRRFGEGIVNGALTARVGVAAMEVCRPLPFVVEKRPSVTSLVQRALTGLFGGGGDKTPGRGVSGNS